MCTFSFKYGDINRAFRYLLLFLGFVISQNLLAQFSSQKGWIEANYNYGCQGLTITITHTRTGAGALFYGFEGSATDPINGTSFEGSFNEGSSEAHTYTEPGVFYVVVVDQSGTGSDADRTDILEITVVADQRPAVSVRGCSSNSVELMFDKSQDPYDGYFIQFGDGNTMLVDGDSPVSYAFATNGTYAINIQGRFNNGDFFSCSTYEVQFTAFDQIPTPVINSITVEDETIISLIYDDLDAALNYTLQIDRGTGFQDLTTLDPTTNPQSIILNEPSFNTSAEFYGFKIVAEDQCQTNSSESVPGYSIAFDQQSESVNTTFNISLTWATGNQNFSSIDLLRDSNIFQSFNTEQSSGESISFTSCTDIGELSMTTTINGIISTSGSFVPFDATPPTLPSPGDPIAVLNGAVVNVTFPSTNFSLGEYILYRKDIDPSFQEVFRTASTQLTDTTIPGGTKEVCYQIAYADECGNISALSGEICIVISSSLSIPNAFSPNGDGVNDIFKINDGIYANFRLSIFNRWGAQLFTSTDPTQGWDGEFEGQPVNSGTYLYRLTFQNADNLPITKSGSFVLIR